MLPPLSLSLSFFVCLVNFFIASLFHTYMYFMLLCNLFLLIKLLTEIDSQSKEKSHTPHKNKFSNEIKCFGISLARYVFPSCILLSVTDKCQCSFSFLLCIMNTRAKCIMEIAWNLSTQRFQVILPIFSLSLFLSFSLPSFFLFHFMFFFFFLYAFCGVCGMVPKLNFLYPCLC